PVVKFSVADGFGKPVVGLGNATKKSTDTVASLPNLAFSIAKLVPASAGSPSKWVSYVVTTVPTTTVAAAPTRPGTDNTGTLVDNGDGSYQYTFFRDITKIDAQVAAMTVSAPNSLSDLGDLSYNAALTHRLTIQLSGNAPGTGTNTPTGATSSIAAVPMKAPFDAIYDFIPATGKAVTASDPNRVIVANAKCQECHQKLGGIPGLDASAASAGFHGGSRNDVSYCVVCHTEQRKYGRSESVAASVTGAVRTFSAAGTYVVDGRAVGNLPNLVHKIHAGPLLAQKNYNFAGVTFNETTYPQDLRNCTKCHDGSATSTAPTPQGDNWKSMPSQLACGSCHDGINFATGTGVTIADAAKGLTSTTFGSTGLAHPAGPLPDDSNCALCHKPSFIDTDLNHLPVTPPSPDNALLAAGTNANTNAAWIASNPARLPAGALTVSYDLKSVSRNASKQPVMVFRILQGGVRKDLNVFASAAVNPADGQKEILDNFVGAPSVYFVYALKQDGIAAPADFNATASSYLRSLWNGTASGSSAGTLTGPDGSGYYTATLTGVTIPDSAVMLTGGLGYSYNNKTTLPLTQTNLPDFPTAAATGSGLTAGMPNITGGLIVIASNTQKVATGYTGRRPIVEDARCNACHQQLGAFTEDAFHAGQRNDGSTCSWCHRPNQTSSGWSADSTSFVHSIHAAAKRTVPYNWHASSPTEGFFKIGYPGVLSQCTACHLPGTFDLSAPASVAALDQRLFRTVATGTLAASFANSPYVTAGVNYGAGFSNTAAGVPTDAAPTTLVSSPTATACFACHDSADDISHYKINGGAIYQPRSVALTGTNETCLICHGPGRIADIAVSHNK
ncbi:MAG: OmcA/MtrC family decaheme c-type cytochrome, partial [Ideonella sp.]